MFNRSMRWSITATVLFLVITRKLMKPGVILDSQLCDKNKWQRRGREYLEDSERAARAGGRTGNQPMRLRRFAHIPTHTHTHAHYHANTCVHGELVATRVRIELFPVPVQGYPRSLCSKTLAINLRGGLGSEHERAATWPRRADGSGSAPPPG